MFMLIPAINNQVLVMNEELWMVPPFLMFAATCYNGWENAFGKDFRAYGNDIKSSLEQVDENMLASLRATIDANEQLLGLEEDVKVMTDLKDNLYTVKADTLNHEEQHKFRDEIVRKLDTLASLEDSAVSALKSRMITAVKAGLSLYYEYQSEVFT